MSTMQPSRDLRVGEKVSLNDLLFYKKPRCSLSFLLFFKTPSESTFLCGIWLKFCPLIRTQTITRDHALCLSSFLFFCVLFPCFGSQNVFTQRTKRNKIDYAAGKWQDVHCLFCCWTPHRLKIIVQALVFP